MDNRTTRIPFSRTYLMSPKEYAKVVNPIKTNNGYLYFCDNMHPLASKGSGRVYFHRHVASQTVGYWLTSQEHVHHIDGNKFNNDPSNLLICSPQEHIEIHKGKLQFKNCVICNKEFKQLEKSSKFCSLECSSKSQVKDKTITKELLDELIPNNSWVALGKMFGYSDVGIKKRAKSLGCNISK